MEREREDLAELIELGIASSVTQGGVRGPIEFGGLELKAGISPE